MVDFVNLHFHLFLENHLSMEVHDYGNNFLWLFFKFIFVSLVEW